MVKSDTNHERSAILRNKILIAIAGLSLVSSFAAIADTTSAPNSATERESSVLPGDFIGKLYQSLKELPIAGNGLAEQQHLKKAIQENVGQKHSAETRKYAYMLSLADSRQVELENRKSEASRAYQKWHDLKSAMAASHSLATANDFKAVEAAALEYSKANRAFVELQKEILVKANIPFKDHGEFIAAMP